METMTTKLSCNYCHTIISFQHFLKHILSAHPEEFWALNNKLLHSRYMTEPGESETGTLLLEDCPPYLKIDKKTSQFCCFGCSSAVSRRGSAQKHFPKCLEVHLAKIAKFRLTYPPLAPLAPLVPTLVSTVVQTKVITTTTTIKFGDGNSMAFLSAYHRELEEAKKASKTQYKRMERMREHWKNTHPELLDEWDMVEEEISIASDGDEDPNDILQETAKAREIILPKIKKEVDADGCVNLRV